MKNKRSTSWSKPNIKNLIARKQVDWSIFNWGATIPLEFHEDFNKVNGNTKLKRGDKCEIELVINGIRYKASFVNVDRKGIASDTLQIRYDSNKELKEIIKQEFQFSYEYLQAKLKLKTKLRKKSFPKVSETYAEYIDFYDTGIPYLYRVELLSNSLKLSEDEKKIIESIDEKDLEAVIEKDEFDFEQWLKSNNDDKASIQQKQAIIKVRKYKYSIITNLKAIYNGTCQICGYSSIDDFGVDISQGHHIEYFSKSQNNNPSNIAILCPNHHSLVHATKATFDRADKCFICNNGSKLKLIKNYHL